MKRYYILKRYYKLFFIPLLVVLISGCATVKMKKQEKIITGIKGTVIPVDNKGQVIKQQDREKIIINIVKIEKGVERSNSITVNPNSEGNFLIKLDSGDYSIEIFLEGFYVRSFKINLQKGEIIDLGKIYIKKIETESASPIKGEENVGTILNEGDVNIQPPTY